jgi:type II secretory pathway predicted ATPase ExeA
VSAESIEPVTPQPEFIATAPARALLANLEQRIGVRAPFVLVTGEPGTGKSMLAAEVIARWGDRVSLAELPQPAPEPAALAVTLLEHFGGSAKSGANAFAVLDRLLNVLANATAGGRVAVLFADDAHLLTAAHMLELQRICAAAANRQCPLEFLLVGQKPLAALFDTPELAALAPRVSVRGELAALSANETREYLQLRPNSAGGPSAGVFSRKACRDVYNASLGVLRTIEALATESTRRAQRAGSATVSPEHVRAAANSLRAGRADDAAHTLPPRQERQATLAVITPLPLPKPAAPTPSAAMESPASSDERVKAWVARFGGSGVRIGANTPARASEAAESFEPDSVVVTRRAKQPSAPAAGAVESFEPATVAPLDVAPVSKPAAVEATAPEPVAAAKPAKRPKLIVLEDLNDVPGMSAIRASAPLPKRRAAAPAPGLLVALGVALLALAVSQHDALGRLAAITFPKRDDTRAAVAPAPLPAPAPVSPLAPQATNAAQYAIAVGSFPTRDMALAEADYISRLVPLRVKVASAGSGGHGYRLLLGKFDSMNAAEQSMRKLQSRGLIPDAKTVTLPSALNGGSDEPAKQASRHRRSRHR